ncbi:MAG: hypothetical protein ACOYN0_09465 [Phycisphaerales bacterium]
MMVRSSFMAGLLAAVAGGAHADVTFLSQAREITALTSFDGNAVSRQAADFGLFAEVASASVEFPLSGGGAGVNTADSTINCILDPNAIRAFGSLGASGGIGLVGGRPEAVFGEAAATILVSFEVTQNTPFSLIVSPRPSTNPNDEFQVELSALVGGNENAEIRIDERDAPQWINHSGVLTPGTYEILYRVELTGDAASEAGEYTFNFTIPAPGAGLVFAGLPLLMRRRR